MGPLIRAWAFGLVRVFYPERSVSGLDRLPASGAAIVVANHPNGLIDPLILSLAVGRPVAFLGKSTLFANPFGRAAMAAFDGLPVYRAHEADTSRNEATFAGCRRWLGKGGWLALFPEGKSHDATTLQPLKTGAARIALGARAEGVSELWMVPVGLFFSDKAVFRSGAAVAIGTPIAVPPGDPADRDAVQALTDTISDALAAVVLEADNAELWRGFLAVAGWMGARDLGEREAQARVLSARWRSLVAHDPEAASKLAEEVRRFARVLRAVGVSDPFAIEAPGAGLVTSGVGSLVLLAPAAAVGAALAWLPYRLVRPGAERLAGGHTDIVGTTKLLLGFTVLTPVYLAWAIAAGIWFGPALGVAMAVLGPLTGYAALRFDEVWTLRGEAFRGALLHARGSRLPAAIAARREELVARIRSVLSETGA